MKTLSTFAIAVLLLVAGARPASAYNIPPFATDHEAFLAQQGQTDLTPGETCTCPKYGSPVEVKTGNLSQVIPIFRLAGRGPRIDLTLTYHSIDHRIGPFGAGWTLSYDQRLTKTTDGNLVSALLSTGAGRRDIYRRAGSLYVTPSYFHNGLIENPDGSWILREKDGTSRQFSSSGYLTTITERNNDALKLAYDTAGALTTITDATGRAVEFVKGADGRMATIVDPAGRRFQFSYDSSGNLTGLSDPLGNATTLQYDEEHHLTQLNDPRGNPLFRATYNADGTVKSYTDRGETWSVTYTPASNRTTETDSAGRRWVHIYNTFGTITQTIDPLNNSIQRVFDANLNLIQSIDQNGHATLYTYDANGNLVTIRNALGNTVVVTYESTYGLPLTVTDTLGHVSSYSYDGTGNLTALTDARGRVTRYRYDESGQLVGVTDALGNSSSLSYDQYGNIVGVTDPSGHASSSERTILGDIVAATDASGRTTQFVYDDNRRLVRSLDPLGGIIHYEYDQGGNVTAFTDAKNQTTTYQYDILNRVVKSTNARAKSALYVYDVKDNLTARTDPNGFRTTYEYDAVSRRIRRNGSEVVTYGYDKAGFLVNVSNNSGSVLFVYDALNHQTQARTVSLIQPSATVGYTYDVGGRRVTMTNPAGAVTTYAYDEVSRLVSVTDGSADTFGFSYDDLSRRVGLSAPLGRNVSYAWDKSSRLVGIADVAGAASLALGFTYDAVGNVLSRSSDAGVDQYSYDIADRLVGATHPPGQPNESYEYDIVGNRLTSNTSHTYVHDAGNRLLADDTYDYLYDDNGNLIRKTTRATGVVATYTYDSENQLSAFNAPGVAASYRYDGLGRRIRKTVNNVSTSVIYDGEAVVAEYVNGNLAATFTHGSGLVEPLSVKRGGTTHYFRQDALGSVTQTFSSSGVTSTTAYDSYGRIVARSGTAPASYAFAGGDFDAETQLYYYRSRYYDPSLGRFISEDSIGLSGGDANLYSYVGANPLRGIDPFGTEWWKPWTWFDKQAPALAPLDSGGTRQDVSRDELEHLMSPSTAVSPSVSKDLDRGCIGLAAAYQGAGQSFPEEAPGTQCYLQEADAVGRQCASSDNFVFAKQGQWAHGAPTADSKTKLVPTDSVSSADGNYNYITRFDSTNSYAWMNNAVQFGEQKGTVSNRPVNDPHYPHTIWCSTCQSK